MTAVPTQPPEHLSLAALFEEADREQWQGSVAAALRKSGLIGEDAAADAVEAVLTTTTYDGVEVLPLYTADDALPADAAGVPGVAPFVRGSRAGGPVPTGWDVRQRHAHPDPEVTREAVMADLENGVSSLWLVVGRGGLPLGSLDRVLANVYLDLAPVVIDAGSETEAAAEEFLAVIGSRGVLPESVRGNLGADPIGLRARDGVADTGAAGQLDISVVPRLARQCLDVSPGLRAVTVDATVYHDAGGSDAEELGASLATGLAYLRALTEAGLSLDQAFGQLEFRYAATADQFLTIAKFRAARRLWDRVAEVCGAANGAGSDAEAEPGARVGQRQHAVTSSAMMTRRDPWVNLLRTTLACFGAGVGGAEAVTVQPFDAALGLPDGFARRIARNTSSLLVMESHLARVIDPAGGSWYVERLTDELAAAAWAWFTEIERAGGIVAALDSGLVAQRLESTWSRRADRLAHRQDALTGVSEFPNLAEKPVVRAPFPDADRPGAGGLPARRYAQGYEALRDAADADAESTGTRAAVFLATLGPAAAHTARATFAANLFQAGGLATPTSGLGTDPETIAEALRASGARVACLASSDRVYADHAVPVARALKAAGAGTVWLAGNPGERAAEYAAAGIDGYVYTGVDALAVLRDVHRQSGI
jgi:methylmalonyl-CoA mutase